MNDIQNMNNMMAKIEWAEIAGECINSNQEEGYKRAMVMYEMYDARYLATQTSSFGQKWNRVTLGYSHPSWNYRVQDNAQIQDAYRAMVRANVRSKQI